MKLSHIFGLIAVTALCACEPFNRPLGDGLDEGGFGNPTMQNIMAHRQAQRTNPITYTVSAAQERQAAAAAAPAPTMGVSPTALTNILSGAAGQGATTP